MPDTFPPNEPAAPEAPEQPPSEQAGQVFDTSSQPPSAPPEPSEAPTTLPPREAYVSGSGSGGRHSKIWLLLLLIVVIVAGAVVAAHYVLKMGNQQQNTQTGTIKKDIPDLTYGLPDGDLTQMYPNNTTATSLQVNSQLFEGLVRYDQQTRIVPSLATDWSNPDTSTWVFNLRHDVVFHDGRAMTAQDVKYSLDYAIQQQASDTLTNLAAASTIKKVDVTGTYQVKITTDGPDPILLNRLAFLFIVDSKGTLGDPNGGTGPYTVKAGTKPTETSIDLVAANKYYGGHIYTRELHVFVIKNADTLTQDINNGQLALAGSLDNSQLAKITRHYQAIKRQDLGVSFLGINTLRTDSPFATAQGRQAAAYALNVPAILKAGNFRGTQASQLIPSQLPGYDPSIKNTPYDPAKAKALLASVKNASAPLTLSYASDETDGAYFDEIVKELQAVGFNIKTAPVPDLDTLLDTGFGGKSDMFSLTDDSATLDGLTFFNDILQGNQIYHNTDVDSLVKQASTTIDPTARIVILQKISQIVAKDVPVIPMYTPTDVFTLTKPYYMQIDIPSAWAGIYFWQVYQK